MHMRRVYRWAFLIILHEHNALLPSSSNIVAQNSCNLLLNDMCE